MYGKGVPTPTNGSQGGDPQTVQAWSCPATTRKSLRHAAVGCVEFRRFDTNPVRGGEGRGKWIIQGGGVEGLNSEQQNASTLNYQVEGPVLVISPIPNKASATGISVQTLIGLRE